MSLFGCSTYRFTVIGAAVLLAAVTRLLPHPPNFAPMTAMALFVPATLRDRRLALLTPLLALFVSDLGIDALYSLGLYPRRGIYSGMWMNYTAFLLVVGLGFFLRGRRSLLPIAGATLAGSIIFFLVSNFGVWIGGSLYPHTLNGLLFCYTEGLPFFDNSLLGDIVYSTALFGGFAVAERLWPILRERPAVSALQPIVVGVSPSVCSTSTATEQLLSLRNHFQKSAAK